MAQHLCHKYPNKSVPPLWLRALQKSKQEENIVSWICLKIPKRKTNHLLRRIISPHTGPEKKIPFSRFYVGTVQNAINSVCKNTSRGNTELWFTDCF